MKLSKENKLKSIQRARKVLNGQELLTKDLKDLYAELEATDQFAYATEVLLKKMKADGDAGIQTTLKEFQTLVKFIYKDHSLPSSFKFDTALKTLSSHDDLATTKKCETLGLAGAIYKRKWQFDHQFKNLVFSNFYYKQGYEHWKSYLQAGGDISIKGEQNDKGFTAINYAYVNELMAVDRLEEQGKVTGVTDAIDQGLKLAENERKFILDQFVDQPFSDNPVVKNNRDDKWVMATIAEAYFGLRKYTQAQHFINAALQLHKTDIGKNAQEDVSDSEKEKLLEWELRSFSKQLFSVAYLQLIQQKFFPVGYEKPTAVEGKLFDISKEINLNSINDCLRSFVLADEAVSFKPAIKKDGKTGLALSGGGFRASMFHIGVLAALAEADELRNIEVISCVSGGSIIGAYYYLKLKLLLETKTDEAIKKEDYIRLVKETETGFVKGVQENLRMHLFSDIGCSIKMLTQKNYSRTHRMGELYERFLFKNILTGKDSLEALEKELNDCTNALQGFEKKDDNNTAYNDLLERKLHIEAMLEKLDTYSSLLEECGGNIYMQHLYINPKLAAGSQFDFLLDNWKRKNKIPQLVLNATSVNTGHNWQFTASWMGEPPGNIQADIDAKPRLRRMYYQEAPDGFKNFRLGYAVGASSCVPVMFEPMPMKGLYENIDLQLIDGGLHDNQGIAALIEQECTNMIISDASGQLPTNKVTVGNNAALFLRADNILQERLRELQFLDIKERSATTQINRLVMLHLKNGLYNAPESWKYCQDPPRTLMYEKYTEANENYLTRFGILRESQLLLSEVRTDLDSFNDIESFGLMYSGYAQVKYAYGDVETLLKPPADDDWKFLQIKEYVSIPEKAVTIEKPLATAKKRFGKVYDLSNVVKVVVAFLIAAAMIPLGYYAYQHYNDAAPILSFSTKWLVFTLFVFIVGLFSKIIANTINYKGVLRKWIGFLILIVLGFIISNIYLKLFNGVYNKAGTLKPSPTPSDSNTI